MSCGPYLPLTALLQPNYFQTRSENYFPQTCERHGGSDVHSALVSVQPRWGAEVCQTIRHMAQLFVLQLRRTPLIGGSLCRQSLSSPLVQLMSHMMLNLYFLIRYAHFDPDTNLLVNPLPYKMFYYHFPFSNAWV